MNIQSTLFQSAHEGSGIGAAQENRTRRIPAGYFKALSFLLVTAGVVAAAGPTNDDLGKTCGVFALNTQAAPTVDIVPRNSDHSYTMQNIDGKEYVLVTVNMPDGSEDMRVADVADFAVMKKDIAQMAGNGTTEQIAKDLQARLGNAVPGPAPVPAASTDDDDDEYEGFEEY